MIKFFKIILETGLEISLVTFKAEKWLPV